MIISLFVTGLTISAVYAYYTIFAVYAPSDDEGFILISLKSFFQGHALYDKVYSCYQPFFYVFNWFVFALSGATLCHDNIRILTIVLWLTGAALNAVIAYRFTSSSLLSLLVLILSVAVFRMFSNEPGHPVALACLLVVATVAIFAFMDRLPRIVFALTIGFLLGFLLLTKINVGVYILLSVVLVFASGTAGVFSVRLQAVIGAIMIVLPVIIMHSRLTQLATSNPSICVLVLLACVMVASFMARSRRSFLYLILAAGVAAVALAWFRSPGFPVFYFAVLVTSSICSVVLVARANRPGTGIDSPTWMWAMVGGGAAIVAVLLVVALRGTSMQGMLNGLFWAPLTQSTDFYCDERYPNLEGSVIALCGLSACGWYLWSRKLLGNRPSFHVILAVTKLLFGLVFLAFFTPLRSFLPFRSIHSVLWMLPFVWLAVESETKSPTERVGRLALVAVSIMQSLGYYPVAGSQLALAIALMPVIAAVCLADAVRVIIPPMSSVSWFRWMWLAVGGIAAFAMLYHFGYQARIARWNYFSHTPLDLPGASRIRLTSKEVHRYQDLVRPLAHPEVETFLTLPGFNSLYFWAQKDPPTGFNVTTWMFLLDDRCQELIWEAASKHRGLMTVRNRGLAKFWAKGRPLDRFPLVRHIDQNFQTVEIIDGYELMVRR